MTGKEIRNTGITALAERCGRSKTTISRVIRGQQKPGTELRRRLEAEGIRVPTLARSRG